MAHHKFPNFHHICFLISSLIILSSGIVIGDAAAQKSKPALKVTHSQNTGTVPIYEVFEITFDHQLKYENPFFDVSIEVHFTAPSGKIVQVGGFHYGSLKPPEIDVKGSGERKKVEYIFDKQNIWKARYAPSELGDWTYTYTFSNLQGEKAVGSGAFKCVKGRSYNPGFVRHHPENPFRWVFDDGSPYFPIGLQECWGDGSANGSVVDEVSMEGPFRMDRQTELPDGPMFKRGPSNNPQNGDIHFRYNGQCGFNLFRFSQQNCSYVQYRDLDHYLVQEGIMTDELLLYARKYGFRIFYGIFGYQKVFTQEPDNAEGMAKVKRFIKYTVDRWGAYVDFWQFLNEQKAEAKWYEIVTPYLREIDPYSHPITTSWQRPELPGIEINAPHWYSNENELNSDRETASRAKNWKKHNKPVIVGEQGNRIDRKKPVPPGVGGVWDIGSARRMRIRNWTAFFHEIAFIFWDTSYARDGHYMNIWLGPKEREYVRSMQDFAYSLDRDVRMIPVTVSNPEAVRAYGLASTERAGVYLHHFQDHVTPVRDLTVSLDVPKAAKGYWYSTEDAAILDVFDVPAGKGSFRVPEFVVDIALLITPDGAPDIDKDGKPNHQDPDDDNDGVPDELDAFPLDPEEWEDEDGDLIGDNLDADDDGDGTPDDENGNGIPDHEEFDLDGDGVDKSRAIPWDVFPRDPGESRDTDGDGIGDNADTDDDGDGWSDAEEKEAGTDPTDKLSFPTGNE